MGAALRPGDGVHLVEDQRVDAAQQLARARREQEEERLRRRDQDVRRLAEHRRALLLRRVAGADGDAELRPEPGERPAEVPLDVVVERLERRDVEHAQPDVRRSREPVDRRQERRERLPRAGRRLDEDVSAARDRRPALLLRGRRRGEVPLEPGARFGPKESSAGMVFSLQPPSWGRAAPSLVDLRDRQGVALANPLDERGRLPTARRSHRRRTCGACRRPPRPGPLPPPSRFGRAGRTASPRLRLHASVPRPAPRRRRSRAGGAARPSAGRRRRPSVRREARRAGRPRARVRSRPRA